jgi:HEAT repeat protein
MATDFTDDEQQLLEQLRKLFEKKDPVPTRVRRQAMRTFAFGRLPDDAELLELVHDSDDDPPSKTRKQDPYDLQ